jgi:hypothetical protein
MALASLSVAHVRRRLVIEFVQQNPAAGETTLATVRPPQPPLPRARSWQQNSHPEWSLLLPTKEQYNQEQEPQAFQP